MRSSCFSREGRVIFTSRQAGRVNGAKMLSRTRNSLSIEAGSVMVWGSTPNSESERLPTYPGTKGASHLRADKTDSPTKEYHISKEIGNRNTILRRQTFGMRGYSVDDFIKELLTCHAFFKHTKRFPKGSSFHELPLLPSDRDHRRLLNLEFTWNRSRHLVTFSRQIRCVCDKNKQRERERARKRRRPHTKFLSNKTKRCPKWRDLSKMMTSSAYFCFFAFVSVKVTTAARYPRDRNSRERVGSSRLALGETEMEKVLIWKFSNFYPQRIFLTRIIPSQFPSLRQLLQK